MRIELDGKLQEVFRSLNNMTASFAEFMREYQMTGSEKADGYSRTVFVGLEPHEKDEVFKLLLNELPYSAKWLFFLDAEKAMTIVKEEERALRGDKYKSVFMLQEKLVEYTGDLTYQDRMIEDYPHYVDYLRRLVVDSIGRIPFNSASLLFFQQVILTETDADIVARAAHSLLAALDIPRTTAIEKADYVKLEDELRSGNRQAKLRLFEKMNKQKNGFSVDI